MLPGTVDDHFAKSLGNSTWSQLKAKSDPIQDFLTGSVDEHFTKALGDTWLRIKSEKEGMCSDSSDSSPPPQRHSSMLSTWVEFVTSHMGILWSIWSADEHLLAKLELRSLVQVSGTCLPMKNQILVCENTVEINFCWWTNSTKDVFSLVNTVDRAVLCVYIYIWYREVLTQVETNKAVWEWM